VPGTDVPAYLGEVSDVLIRPQGLWTSSRSLGRCFWFNGVLGALLCLLPFWWLLLLPVSDGIFECLVTFRLVELSVGAGRCEVACLLQFVRGGSYSLEN